jgi:hypothetical protein
MCKLVLEYVPFTFYHFLKTDTKKIVRGPSGAGSDFAENEARGEQLRLNYGVFVARDRRRMMALT